MKCKGDGFNSTYPTGTFTGHGHKITVSYHHLTGLPLLHTAPSDHYHQYCIQSHACTSILQSLPQSESTSMFLLSNLMPAQRIKLILHEHCNQVNMQQLNHWIRKGHFPVDPSFANSPDPMCCACRYGKAEQKAHSVNRGSISAQYNYLGAGINTDQMEVGYPGKMLTTRGFPSPLH